MKYIRLIALFSLLAALLTGCGTGETAQTQGDTIIATTYPMYYLTQRLTEGVDGVQADVLVQESVSCIHDYTLTTTQMRKLEQAAMIVMNGSGLEHFMESALESVPDEKIVDTGAALRSDDAHTWLSVEKYTLQAQTLSNALEARYPQQAEKLRENYTALEQELSALQSELEAQLSGLSCRELVTFHDGFSSFAESLELTIAAAIEEEEGAEASAQQIQEICTLIETKHIPGIFVEKNGSTNAAKIISGETGVKTCTLNTMMDGETDYFSAMRENVQAVKEALS